MSKVIPRPSTTAGIQNCMSVKIALAVSDRVILRGIGKSPGLSACIVGSANVRGILVARPRDCQTEVVSRHSETRLGIGHGFTGCGKTRFPEGDGLQPVHNHLAMSAALAAEGYFPLKTDFLPQPPKPCPSYKRFSASSLGAAEGERSSTKHKHPPAASWDWTSAIAGLAWPSPTSWA